MYGGSAVVAAVVVFERFDQPGKIEPFVYLNKQMVGIDEVSKTLVGELEKDGVPAVAVERIERLGVS